MGQVTSGVFPVHVNQFEINTGAEGTETWVTVAELEEVNVSIDNNTETWKSFASGGWDSSTIPVPTLNSVRTSTASQERLFPSE